MTGTIDGAVRTWRFRLLAVVIGDYVERPGHMLVRAPVDAGRLTLYVLAHLSLARTLRLALGFALGDWRRLPDVERVPATSLTIASEARALRVMNDGEVTLIPAPLRYRIHRQALTVIVPKTAAIRETDQPYLRPAFRPHRPGGGGSAGSRAERRRPGT